MTLYVESSHINIRCEKSWYVFTHCFIHNRGLAAFQLAVALGCEVTATATSGGHNDRILAVGALHFAGSWPYCWGDDCD